MVHKRGATVPNHVFSWCGNKIEKCLNFLVLKLVRHLCETVDVKLL